MSVIPLPRSVTLDPVSPAARLLAFAVRVAELEEEKPRHACKPGLVVDEETHARAEAYRLAIVREIEEAQDEAMAEIAGILDRWKRRGL